MPENLNEKVLQLQLVNALTANNTDAVLATILKINNQQQLLTYGSPLHLVVNLSPYELVEHVIKVFCDPNSSNEWINSQNQDKETPLHIASKLGRERVLEALLKIPYVNDTIRQVHGKTPQEVAKDDRTRQIFKKNRNDYCIELMAAMNNAVAINDHTGLEALFASSPRAQAYLKHGWLDINASLDKVNERSFLHLAARADNLELVVWGLKYGADPNCTDSKGKKPVELAKSEKVKDLLKHAKSNAAVVSESLSQATSADTPNPGVLEAPSLQGILSKYTNLKDGYQNRFFVLENGVFSYYHSAQDYPLQCRGSIATKALTAHFSGSDQTRFDVSVEGSVKFYLRARSVAEAKKWVWALMESKRWMIDHSKEQMENHDAPSGDTPSDFGSSAIEPMDMSKELAEVKVIEALDTEEERNDLLEYLDKHGSTGFHNPELKRLLVLLKTELDAQKSTVTTVSSIMGDVAQENLQIPIISELKELPHLLADSSMQIEALVYGIVKFMNRRETVLEQRLENAKANVLRLESIMNQLEVDAIKDYKEPAAIDKIDAFAAAASNPHLESSSDSDEFFDAIDDGMTERSAASPSKTEVFYQIPQEVQALQPTDGFISIGALEKLLTGYYKLWPSRKQLPLDPSLPMPKVAVWSFLKSAIGKDLSKITLPVLFNEPLSMLQRFAEDIEYIELLTVAARIGCGDITDTLADPIVHKYCINSGHTQANLQSRGEDSSILRLIYVTAFAISNYSSTVDRTSKPFNPLLGETFEVIHPEKKYRYIAEQVCHHPPISACYCDSPWYQFWAEVNVKSKFWGKSLEALPLGVNNVKLMTVNGPELYSWRKVTTCVSNLILGTLTIDHYGDLEVKNHATGETCTVTFKPRDAGGWFGASADPVPFGKLIGQARDAKGAVKYEISGGWNNQIHAIPKSKSRFVNPVVIWRANQRPPMSEKNFHFTDLSMFLNQMSDDLKKKLPLTDSRLRPDQRAMEEGLWNQADSLKNQIETSQRLRRKEIVSDFERTGVPNGPTRRGLEFGEKWWQPRWFYREHDPIIGEECWKFSGEYWMFRDDSWPKYVFDIFQLI